MSVTKSINQREKILYEINGRPAAEIYCEINNLDYQTLISNRPDGIHPALREYPLGIKVKNEILLKDVLNIDPQNKSLIMIGSIPEHQPVYFFKVSHILSSTRHQINNILQKYDNKVDQLFTFICANRYEDIVCQVKNLDEYHAIYHGINVMGFCCFGEYYTQPVNHTATMLLLLKD
jgi:hypothetical protein